MGLVYPRCFGRIWPAVGGLVLAAGLLAASRVATGAAGPGGPPANLGEVSLHLRVATGEGYSDLHVSFLYERTAAVDPAERHAAALAAMQERFPGALDVTSPEAGAQYVLYPVRWPQPSTTWVYNAAGANPSLAPPDAFAAILAGANGWSGAAGTAWHFDYAGTTTLATGCNGVPGSLPRDGANVVGWGQIAGGFWGYACWWSAASAIPGTTSSAMAEMDIIFDQRIAFSKEQLYRVALHEFGHALGLDHTQPAHCPGTVMCPAANTAALQPDDLAGILALYGPAPPASPTPTTVPASPTPAGPFRALALFLARDR